MPLVNLVLNLFDGTASPIVTGQAALSPSQELQDQPDGMEIIQAPVVAKFAPAGLPVVGLIPTDATGPQPSGWQWVCSFPDVPGHPPVMVFYLPAGPCSFTATHAAPAVFTWTPTSAFTAAGLEPLPVGTGVTLAGGSLPGGFATATTYYVVSSSGATFELAATPGGSPIASTGTGSGTLSVAQYSLSSLAQLTSTTLYATAMPTPTGTPTAGQVPAATGTGEASAWTSMTASFVGADPAGSAATAQANAEAYAMPYPGGSPTSGLVKAAVGNGSTWGWQQLTPALIGTSRSSTLRIAASNATAASKEAADYVCTGSADQTVINTAIGALPGYGGSISLSEGTFTITAPIVIGTSNITLEGQGVATEITVTPGSNLNYTIGLLNSYTVECKIRRLFLQGSYGDVNGHGIWIDTPWGETDTQHVLEDVYITNQPGDGVHVAVDADTRVLLFNRVHVKNVKGCGFNFTYPSCTDSVFTDCIADTCGQHGFSISTANCWFQNCKTFYCGSSGSSYFGFFIAGYNNYFESCQAQDNYYHGFYGYGGATDPTYGAFGCTFVNCSGDANGQSAPSSGLLGNGVQEWQVIGGVWFTRPYETSWQQQYGITWQDAVTGPSGLRESANNSVTGALFRNNSAGDMLDTSSGVNYLAGNVSDASAMPSRLQGKLTIPALQVTEGLPTTYGNVWTAVDTAGNGEWLPPYAADLSGQVAIANGGTSATTAAAALVNLGAFRLLASTGTGGYTLVNGTGDIITWTAPSDGALHRVMVIASLHVTSAQTGGAVQVYCDYPDGYAASPPVFPGGSLSGGYSAGSFSIVQPGEVVQLAQESAMTSGAAVLWAEIWGL